MDHSIEAALAAAVMPPILHIGRLQFNCDKHGPYLARGVRLRTREVWDGCPGCSVDLRRADDAHRDAKRAEQNRRAFEAKLDAAAVPVRFVGKTLDNFSAATEATRSAVTVARDYIENFEHRLQRGEGLIFSGMPGTGKSHIAAAILQGILPRHVGLYLTCMQAIRMVRDTWRKDSERKEREVLKLLGEVPLLVLDEVGMQYGTDGEQTILFDILDNRYRNMKPSVLLTNQDAAGLKVFVGERTFDRLTETCRWIPFDWHSYRPRARKHSDADGEVK